MKIKPQPARTDKKALKTPSGKTRKKPKKITESYLHNSGLFYLQRYASSAENFRRVMGRKVKKSCSAHPEQDYEECMALVEKLTQSFIASGLINDALYARGSAISQRRQGKSRSSILMKLRTKGITEDLSRMALQDIDQENTSQADPAFAEYEAAMIFARKKRLGPYARSDRAAKDPEAAARQKNRELAAFARNGFSLDIAKRILALSTEDLEAYL